MSAFKESVKSILYFDPGRTLVEGQNINLGRINGCEINFGNYPIQDRLQRARGQPRLFSWRTRPSIALCGLNGSKDFEIRTLFYKTDIKKIDRSAVLEIARCLREWHELKGE